MPLKMSKKCHKNFNINKSTAYDLKVRSGSISGSLTAVSGSTFTMVHLET